MKELLRFAGYALATAAMIGIVVAIAKAGVSPGTLVFSALFIVIVLPLAIGVLMVKRERREPGK